MGGKVLIGAVDAGLVTRGLGDAGLEVVADHRLRHAANGSKRADVHADPIGEPPAPARLRIGEVGCSERATKMWACRVSPVSGSNTATGWPAKSTNTFPPAH